MKEYTIGPESAGKRLDKWLLKELPRLPMGLMQKYLRLKRVKLNGKPAKGDARLAAGDALQLFIEDEFFEKPAEADPFLARFHWHLDIVYEDENILVVDKKPGVMVHPDRTEQVNTLLTHVQAYLYQKGAWDSRDKSQFAPALCNRIDRFTGGLVIVARNEAALKAMNAKIKSREVEKIYLCIAMGHLTRRQGVLDSWIVKPEGSRKVRVSSAPSPGAQRARTGYRVLAERDGLSLVMCRLETGRTHQIRAQFAFIGHPLLGDGQYGDPRESERFGRDYQALYAWSLAFEFRTDGGALDYLNGKRVYARDVPFVREYFPDAAIETDGQ
ncbi:MAG: RluA family pseudouridine synthase [Clostridia bacterium]|nr:RluA family pseudouridine synthase [Clostridia bacterium]MBO4886020.1 RluA family pseudouridine synthase [Clostridia bacterium]